MGPLPYSGRRPRRPPPDCCRSDAHSDTARTNPTSDARRAFSRTDRGVPLSREGTLQALTRSWLVLALTSIRGQEAGL